MPSRWEIQLAGPASAAIPLAAPQAVVSGWLDDPPAHRANAGKGTRRSGHDDQARRWACGPLRAFPPEPGQHGEIIAVQVRLLDDGLDSRLRAAVRAGVQVRLGEHHYEVTGPPELIAHAPWHDLRRWSGARAWQLGFITPACFRRGNRTSPWPAPETLARSLTDRWRQLHPPTAPASPQPGRSAVWVSDIDGRSEVQTLTRNVRRASGWRLEEEIISGFTGRIRYACDHGTSDEAATFDALMAFAAYAGVGSHTTYGFGVTRPEPTWQPPTTRPATTKRPSPDPLSQPASAVPEHKARSGS